MSDMTSYSSLELQQFFPDELKIIDVDSNEEEIIIHMHSVSKSCKCHRCGTLLTEHHGSHRRKVKDLPILGKRVTLDAQIFDYQCTSESCGSFAATETFDGFLSRNSRMTERLEDFVCMLALETSCESAARILNSVKAKISGDTVIRLLIRRYSAQPEPACGSAIGVDDFAYKKRHTYGTIIVDEKTHKQVAILDGRDGKELKEWLRKNKQVTTVTRDRASAYAKAVEEVLPGCMQVADRFHIHQNLMDAVNKVLGREIPATTAIIEKSDEKTEIKEKLSTSFEDEGKKKCHLLWITILILKRRNTI